MISEKANKFKFTLMVFLSIVFLISALQIFIYQNNSHYKKSIEKNSLIIINIKEGDLIQGDLYKREYIPSVDKSVDSSNYLVEL